MSTSKDPTLRDLNDCGCCEGTSAATPLAVSNRPGLSAIAYRVGEHQTFKESMLAALARHELRILDPATGVWRESRPLSALKTREDEDFTIALLDAWATVGDVLTFYQERFANESYLRTATERVSLLELARLIGYELRPGVAANAYLAFTMEGGDGAPEHGEVPVGTRVLSIPGPEDERPQTYETVEAIEARPEWNAMRPLLRQQQVLTTDAEYILAKGVATNVSQGDRILIVEEVEGEPGPRAIKSVSRVHVDTKAGTTLIELGGAVVYPSLFLPVQAAAVFPTGQVPLVGSTVQMAILGAQWNQADFAAAAQVQNWSLQQVTLAVQYAIWQRPPSNPQSGVFAFRQRASLFGHNAPDWNSLPLNLRDGEVQEKPVGTTTFVNGPYKSKNWEGYDVGDDADNDLTTDIYLDNTYEEVVPSSWIIMDPGPAPGGPTEAKAYAVAGAADVSRSDYTLTAKVTRLQLDSGGDGDVSDTTAISTFKLRGTTVHAQSEALELADLPITEDVEGNVIVLDRAYLQLQVGRPVIVTGERTDLPGVRDSEVMMIAELSFANGLTTVTFETDLDHIYKRDTVTLNANVALATHGETKVEVLGGGDATRPFQKFKLRQSPLTHISAATSSGTASTLEVRVDDVLWREVDSLVGQGPDQRVYVTQTDDDANTTVIFGDGRIGSRVPTGVENIKATYRVGIGLDGLVKAGQLSLLATKPLGVRAVSNPVDASGAEDRENLADARRNASLEVLTLGRIVSLKDYEDYARAFAGVAKALATWTWAGDQRQVLVTVAGPQGADIEEGGVLHTNLVDAMKKAGDPHVPLLVKNYDAVFFQIVGSLKVHRDHLPDVVLPKVEQALRERFSFEARDFGRSVAASEVIAAIMAVEGVEMVDLDGLFETGNVTQEASPVQRLTAAVPVTGSRGEVFAAQLLLLDPRPISLGVS